MKCTLIAFMFLIMSVIVVHANHIDNCSAKYAGVVLPNGKSFCEEGDFLASLLNGMNALKVSSSLSSERVPVHTPEMLMKWVNEMGSSEAHAVFNMLTGNFDRNVGADVLEMLSPFLHYNGKSEIKMACEKLDDNSFIVVESSVGAGLLQSCDHKTMMHPSKGVVLIPAGAVGHHVLVSYSENEQVRNMLRSRGVSIHQELTYPATAVIPHLGYSPVIPYNATRFTQCDSKWGSNPMYKGETAETVCAVGCLMTSVATSLYNHGIKFKLGGVEVQPNPGTFNEFVRNNDGYTSSNQMIHTVVEKICEVATTACQISLPDDFKQDSLTYEQLKKRIDSKQTVVANVSNGRHFVLAIGYDTVDNDVVYVSDSRSVYNPSYKLSEVVGWRLYDIAGPK